MPLLESLRELGLSSSEIRVYLYLLERGLSTPPQIAKGTHLQRTNSYQVLHTLIEKGLILEQSKGARKAYLPNDPEALFVSLERKKEIVSAILPDLRGLHNVQKNKPKIRFFDGLTAIQEIYWQALDSEEIFALGSTDRLYALMPVFIKKWTDQVKKRQIVLRDIVTHPSQKTAVQAMSQSLKGFYSVKMLPAKFGELPTDLLLWKDNVALITLEEPYFGTILTNTSLVKTFRCILELLKERL